jgi:FkbM family methyltransferase
MYHIGVGLQFQELDVILKSWPDIKVFGCEPHPHAYEEALKTYPGTLTNVALSNQIGDSFLFGKKGHTDGSTLFPHEEWLGRNFPVKTTTLDALYPVEEGFPRLQPENQVLLWLDCEGSELDVLQGGEVFLQNVDVVNVELTSKRHNEKWGKPTDIYSWLAERDFYIQWIHTQRIHAGQTDGVFVRSKLFRPELCCIPHEVLRFEKQS